jgi:hypothetical protein
MLMHDFQGKNAPTKSQIIVCTPIQVHNWIEHIIGTQRKVFTKRAHCPVYTWYIPSIYLSLCSSWTLSCPFRLPGSLSLLRPGRLADQLRIGHRQTTNARLGAPKCPKPSVDLIQNERYLSKKVFNPSNIESRNEGGLIQFSHSVWLHGASHLQAQILKDSEEDQGCCLVYDENRVGLWQE